MSTPDPMSTHVGGDTLHGRLRCSATSKQKGIRCGRTAIPGGTVCRYHGGAAPQVMKSARERLGLLTDPAITRMEELIKQTEYPSTALAASRDILDRNGFGAPDAPDRPVVKVKKLVILMQRRPPGWIPSS